MDLHSCGHRISLIHPDIHDLATDSPDIPDWGPYSLNNSYQLIHGSNLHLDSRITASPKDGSAIPKGASAILLLFNQCSIKHVKLLIC